MLTKKTVGIGVAVISLVDFLVGFALGLMYYNNAIFSTIIGFCPALVTFITLYILDKKQKKTTNEKWKFGEPLTRKTENGSYMLDAENVFEAVEKLGYYEHEMERSREGDDL